MSVAMQFLAALRERRNKVVTVLILEVAFGWPFKHFRTPVRRALAFTLVSLLLFAGQMRCTLLDHPESPPFILGIVIATLVTAFALFIPCWTYNYVIKRFSEIPSTAWPGHNTDAKLARFIRLVTNPLTQGAASLIAICLIVCIILSVRSATLSPFAWKTSYWVSIILATGSIAQGGYWSVAFPLITLTIRQAEVNDLAVHPLCPSRSAFLATFSRLFSMMPLWQGFMVTLCLVGVITLRPAFGRGNVIYIFGLLGVGYCITIWTFVFTQLNLGNVVQRRKQQVLTSIEDRLQCLYGDGGVKPDALSVIQEYLQLHQRIEKTPNSFLESTPDVPLSHPWLCR